MPPSFLVDADGQRVDAFGGIEALLKIKPRRPSQNLLDMLDDDLRAVISGVLHRVRRDGEPVRYPAVPVGDDGRRLSLVAEPLRDSHRALTHTLIALADPDGAGSSALVPPFADVPGASLEIVPHPEAAAHGGLSRDQIQALEEELSYTKQHLQAVVQEHEARTKSSRRPTRNSWPRTKSCRAPTRSCTPSTRRCTPSTRSTRRRTPNCRSSTTTWSTC